MSPPPGVTVSLLTFKSEVVVMVCLVELTKIFLERDG